MSSVNLPAVISNYFAAKAESDIEETLACFWEDATVWDNGEDLEINGISNIRGWMSKTVAGYKLTSEVISHELRGVDLVAHVVASGDFPGSPYKFEYRFKLKGEKIIELSIDPIGSLAS
jgi:ketosteroid isomerase-like protein